MEWLVAARIWLMTFLSHIYVEGRLIHFHAGFLERFEQLKHAREGLPGVGAGSAYSTLKPSVFGPVDIEEKAHIPQLTRAARSCPQGATLGSTLCFAFLSAGGRPARGGR